MAARTMKDFLTAKTATYTTTTLSVTPQSILPEMGYKTQIAHTFDDGSMSVASVSDASYFDVELQFNVLTESDAGTILDFWHSTSKANGMENTFYWDHPKETNVYVARFLGPITKTNKWIMGLLVSVDSVKLRVEGYKTP